MQISDDRRRDVLVTAIGCAMLAGGVALWLDHTLALGAAVSLCLTLAAALGALRDGRLGPFAPWLTAALAAWLVAFTLMHLLPADTETLWLGLPPATSVSVYLLWPAPLLLVTLPYALHFERHVLSRATARAFEEGRDEA